MIHPFPERPGQRPRAGVSKDDETTEQVENDLVTLYHASTPPRLRQQITALAASLEQPAPTPIRQRQRGLQRISWWSGIAAALAVAIITGVVVVAANGWPDLDKLFKSGFGTENVVEEDRGQVLNLTQDVEGFTVTVGRVYADPFQSAVAFRIEAPPKLRPGIVTIANETLFDQQGRFLPNFGLQTGATDHDMASSKTLLQAYTNPLEGSPSSLKYRLEISGFTWEAADGRAPTGDALPGVPCARGEYFDSCAIVVDKPIVFEFEVPLEPGVHVEPGEKLASNGTPAIVERIVSAPTGTRLDLRGVGPNAAVTIEANGTSYPLRVRGYGCPFDEDDLFFFESTESLVGVDGPWTVRIEVSDADVSRNAPAQSEERLCAPLDIAGTWEFQVEPSSP